MLDHILSLEDFPFLNNQSPFESYITRPEIFFDPIKHFSVTQSNRLPADAQTKIGCAYVNCHTHPNFRVIQQYCDARYAYFNHIEIRTNKPLRLPFYCPIEGLYWSYQLQGKCGFDPKVTRSKTGLNEGEYRVSYSPRNQFTLSVEPGTHILFFFFLVDPNWVLDSGLGYTLVHSMKEKRRNVFLTDALPMDDKINQFLLKLFTLDWRDDVSRHTRILQPIGELVDITLRRLMDVKRAPKDPLKTVIEIRKYIQCQVGIGQIPPVSEIARHFGLSEVYLRQLHRVHYKSKLKAYITDMKLEEARRLLGEEDQTVSAVAFKLGYQGLSTFSKQFKRRYGVPPSEIRPKKP